MLRSFSGDCRNSAADSLFCHICSALACDAVWRVACCATERAMRENRRAFARWMGAHLHRRSCIVPEWIRGGDWIRPATQGQGARCRASARRTVARRQQGGGEARSATPAAEPPEPTPAPTPKPAKPAPRRSRHGRASAQRARPSPSEPRRPRDNSAVRRRAPRSRPTAQRSARRTGMAACPLRPRASGRGLRPSRRPGAACRRPTLIHLCRSGC